MAENKNDQRNQQNEGKSHEQQTQEGKKKTETDPNNPTAQQNNQNGSDSRNQEGKMPNTDKAQSNKMVEEPI